MRVKKNNNKYLLIGGITIAVFLVSRLYNILTIPIFNDEAIYINWAETFREHLNQPFVSLIDGKQPFFIWVVSALLRIIHNPLLAGRLASVIAGLCTMVGLYLVTNELFKSRRVALFSCLFYIVFPFSLMYDKMALYDSMVATFAVWSLYFEVLLIKKRNFSFAVLTALSIGGGLLTKTSADFFLYLIPFSLLLFNFKSTTKYKDFLIWLIYAAAAAAGAYGISSILRLSSQFGNIASKNDLFVVTLSQWIKHPFINLTTNVHILSGYIVGYATIPFLILVILAFFIDKKFIKEKILVFVWFLVPIFALALFGRNPYPRYILFMMMPLIILAAYAAVSLVDIVRIKYIGYALILLLSGVMLWKDFYILSGLTKDTIPQLDYYQFISGYPSGVGVKQAESYIQTEAKTQKVYVATEGTFGLMPNALQDYFYTNGNVIIQPVGVIGPSVPSFLVAESRSAPTYFAFSTPCPLCSHIGAAPKSWNVKPVVQVKKIEEDTYFSLYKITP